MDINAYSFLKFFCLFLVNNIPPANVELLFILLFFLSAADAAPPWTQTLQAAAGWGLPDPDPQGSCWWMGLLPARETVRGQSPQMPWQTLWQTVEARLKMHCKTLFSLVFFP